MKKCFIVLMLMSAGMSSFAGDAVSEPNGKAGVFVGDMNGDTGKNVEGSFSFPLGSSFGAQVDGFYSDVSDGDFFGMGAHLFWRNSEKGLLGITAGAIREDGFLDSWAGGVEAESYLGPLTLGAQGGVANIDYQIESVPFFETDETGYYASAEVGYYPLDDILLSVSYTHALDNGMVRGQIEYQTPLDGMSLFADLAQGNNDYDHALFGIRYYFGKQKALKLRHRQDDPPNVLHSIMYNIGTYSAEFGKKADDFFEGAVPAPPPSPPPPPRR
jgi:hypothetical protein